MSDYRAVAMGFGEPASKIQEHMFSFEYYCLYNVAPFLFLAIWGKIIFTKERNWIIMIYIFNSVDTRPHKLLALNIIVHK